MASLLQTVPYLLPIQDNRSCCQYAGFINVLGKSFRFSVTIPNGGELCKAHIECDWELQSYVKTRTEMIQQKLKESENLSDFMKTFTEIATNCLKRDSVTQKPWIDLNQNILHQLQNIGWEKVINLSEDFSCVEIGCFDKGQRHHILKLVFDKEAQLKDLISQFEISLNLYQEFWNCVEEIDKNIWVLEPEHRTYACTYRRLALGQNLSLHIIINSLQPSSLPECRLLGSESIVAPLREKLNVNLHHWDLDRSLLNNLQEVLEIDFPAPSHSSIEEVSVECGICYSHQLGEEIPDLVCQYPQCSQAFHYTCLYEWLRNSSCRQSFNYIFGECPFCSKPMRVKIQLD